jgi:uncharacterized membrane protein
VSRRRRNDQPIEWNFFSFPVAFGFAVGMFVAVILFPAAPAIVFVVSLFFVSFGTAHIISRWMKRRTLDRQRDRDEEAERERRALASRLAAQQTHEEPKRRRRRRVRRGPASTDV